MSEVVYDARYYDTQHCAAKEGAVKNLYRRILSWFDLCGGNGRKALDVGTGLGHGTCLLEELGYESIGLEISHYACEHSGLGERIFCGDMAAPPFPSNSFNLLTAFEVVEHSHDPDLVLQQFHRILKPNGTLLMTTPTPFGNRLLGAFDAFLMHQQNRSKHELHPSIFPAGIWIEKCNAMGFTNIQVLHYLLIPKIFGEYHVLRDYPITTNIALCAVKP